MGSNLQNTLYGAIGRRTGMTVAGQPVMNYGYDANGRLTSVVGAGLAPAQIYYDALGRKTGITLPNGVSTNYTYDNASRLLNMAHKNPANQIFEALTYTYDANGNRTSMNRPSVPLPLPQPVSNTSYNQANQMLTFQPETQAVRNMTYDNNGNLTSATNSCGTTTYTWDARNRLVAINGFASTCTSLTANEDK